MHRYDSWLAIGDPAEQMVDEHDAPTGEAYGEMADDEADRYEMDLEKMYDAF